MASTVQDKTYSAPRWGGLAGRALGAAGLLTVVHSANAQKIVSSVEQTIEDTITLSDSFVAGLHLGTSGTGHDVCKASNGRCTGSPGADDCRDAVVARADRILDAFYDQQDMANTLYDQDSAYIQGCKLSRWPLRANQIIEETGGASHGCTAVLKIKDSDLWKCDVKLTYSVGPDNCDYANPVPELGHDDDSTTLYAASIQAVTCDRDRDFDIWRAPTGEPTGTRPDDEAAAYLIVEGWENFAMQRDDDGNYKEYNINTRRPVVEPVVGWTLQKDEWCLSRGSDAADGPCMNRDMTRLETVVHFPTLFDGASVMASKVSQLTEEGFFDFWARKSPFLSTWLPHRGARIVFSADDETSPPMTPEGTATGFAECYDQVESRFTHFVAVQWEPEHTGSDAYIRGGKCSFVSNNLKPENLATREMEGAELGPTVCVYDVQPRTG